MCDEPQAGLAYAPNGEAATDSKCNAVRSRAACELRLKG